MISPACRQAGRLFNLTLANKVTLARIALIPLVIFLLLLGLNGLALVLFLVAASTDAIDGYIARRYNQVSDLGKFLDPLADKILVICALIALVGTDKAGALPVMILTARELIVQGIRIHAAGKKEMLPAAPIAKWKTVAQIIAIAMLMINLPLASAVLWLAVILSLISGGAYLWQNTTIEQLKLS